MPRGPDRAAYRLLLLVSWSAGQKTGLPPVTPSTVPET